MPSLIVWDIVCNFTLKYEQKVLFWNKGSIKWFIANIVCVSKIAI